MSVLVCIEYGLSFMFYVGVSASYTMRSLWRDDASAFNTFVL